MAIFKNIPITLSTFPAVPIQTALDHLREGVSEQSKVSVYLMAASQSIEQELISVNLTQSVYELQMVDWYLIEDDVLLLPQNPLVSVESVKYYNLSNVLTTLDASNYQIDTANRPGFIRFVGSTLPQVFDRPDAIQVRYTAGHGAVAANEVAQQAAIPAPLKAAVLLRLGQLYENRQEDVTGVTMASFSVGVERLISAYRIPV